MSLLKKAIKDRHVVVDKKHDTLIYLPHATKRKMSNPEEQVQLDTFLELIYHYDYPPQKLKVSDRMKIGSETREADIVIYRDDECKDPYVIVECKKRDISDRVFKGAIDQGFSYAAATNAEYVWATSGDRNAVYEVWHDAIKERDNNRIGKIPNHKELKRTGFSFNKAWRWLIRRPVLSDTMLYATVLIILTAVLSKVAVEFNADIYNATRDLWEKHGMNFLWIFNTISVVATFLSMIFGLVFMRSHRFFRTPPVRRRILFTMIGIVLFVPVWYIGTSMSDPDWWTTRNFNSREYPIIIYLWPYVKSIPFQFMAIYGLIWLMRLGSKQKSS
ncbi:MAG: type I restriction enzyme HsdR N-terminal domain-containing protein [Bacteroidota bacterium]